MYEDIVQVDSAKNIGKMAELHHSPDWGSFIVGSAVGFGLAFLIFTTVGRKVVLTGMGLAKAKAEEISRGLEARLPKY